MTPQRPGGTSQPRRRGIHTTNEQAGEEAGPQRVGRIRTAVPARRVKAGVPPEAAQAEDAAFEIGFRGQDDNLISTVSGSQVGCIRPLEGLPDRTHKVIAGRVAIAIVDAFEAVEIHKEQA